MAIILPGRTLDYASPVNWEAPLNRSLLGWWLALPRWMGGVRWLDLLGRSHGLLAGMGPSSTTSGWGITTRPGGWGELRFDGTNDYVNVGGIARFNFGLGAFAISFWCRRRVSSVLHSILGKYDGATGVTLQFRGDNNCLFFEIYDGTNDLRVTSTAAITDSAWHHYVALRTSTTNLDLYQDGRLMSSSKASVPANANSTTPLILGSYNTTPTSPLQGSLDDVRVYARAPSAAEIAALYRASRQRYPQELTWRRPLSVSVPMALPAPEAPTEAPGGLLQVGRTLDYGQPVNWKAPLNRSLDAWWLALPRRVGGKRWLDLTGRYPATLLTTSAPSATEGFGPTRRPGGRGEQRFAASITGATAGTRVPSPQQLTLAAWVYVIGSEQWMPIAGKTSPSSSAQLDYLLDLGGPTVGFLRFSVANNTTFLSSIPYPLNTWFHVVATYDSAQVARLYLNGRFGQQQTLSLSVTANHSFYIARNWDGTAACKVDDVRLWSRTLSDSEIALLYARSRQGYPAELRWQRPLSVSVPGALPAPEAGAVPSGITILWAGSAASIPTGWSRETALDGRYPKGAPASTNPGSTGGALTHSHTTTGHTHTTAHTHTVPNTTGSSGSSARDTGTTNPPDAHTHASNPNTVDPTTTLASDSPSTDAVSNEPARFDVLFLRSDGTQMGFPASALTLWNDSASAPTNWALCDGAAGRPDMRDRFAKGAAAAGDGGGTGGAATHSHTVASHTHSTPYAHAHPNVTSSQRSEALTTGTISGGAANVATATHTHALTIGSTSPAVTGQSDAVSTVNHEPPYWLQAYIQNISGTLSWPDKVIALWTDPLTSIPANWVLCDGTNGTPDLRDKFIKGATTLAGIGGSGGSLTHGHTATGHTHAVAAHTHTVTGAAGASESRTAGSTNAPTDTHTHTWPATGSNGFTSGTTTPTVANYTDTQPPYLTVVFLQWQAPVPPGGSVNTTEEADTATSAGVVRLQASLSATDGVDTTTSTATLRLQGACSLSDEADTATSTAKLLLTGTLAQTDGADTASSTALLLLQGTLAQTEGSDTLTSSAGLARLGTVSLTDAADVLNSADVPSSAGRNTTWTFAATPVVTCPGASHGVGSTAVRVEVWDTSTPGLAVRTWPAVTLDPTTYDLTLTLATPHPGYLVVNGARMAPGARSNTGVSFTNQTTVTIAGTTHGYGTDALLVDVYDTAGVLLPFTAVTIDRTTFDVTLTFAAPQSGYAVLCMAAATGPVPNTMLTFTNQTTVTLPEATYPFAARTKGIEIWDAATPAHLLTASVVVHPTTFDVTVTFLAPQSGRIVLNGAQATAGLQGTLSVTDEADSASSTATLRLQGTVAVTEVGDTAASTAALALTGTLALTEGNDTLASTTTLRLQATVALLDADDTATSTGVLPLRATLTATEAADTLLSLGISLTGGSLVVTEADDLGTSSGTVRLQATLAVTDETDSLVGLAALRLQGVLSVTDAADTLSSAAGLALQGALSTVDEPDMASSAARLLVQATLALAEAVDSVASTALLSRLASFAAQEADDALTSLSALALQAALAVTEDGDGLASTGSVTTRATLAVTDADDGLMSASQLFVQATLGVDEDADTVASLGAVLVQGVLDVTEEEEALSSTAWLERIAALDVLDADDTLLSLQMELPPTPEWIIVLPAPTLTQSTGQPVGLVQSHAQPVGLFEAKGLADTLMG